MYKEIEQIKRKYNEMVFRMGLQHLVECGAKLLSDKKVVEEECKRIMSNTPKNSIMTPEFTCDILRCAAELAKIDPLDLFRYIKLCLDFDNIKVIEGRIVSFQANCTGKEYWKCIIPSDTDEEVLEDVEKRINEMMDAHGKRNAGDFSDFDMVNNIVSAFNQFGIKAKDIAPDIVIYI